MKYLKGAICFGLLFVAAAVDAENNITFLDKDVIKNLPKSVFEVVVPKLESEKITYERPLPFDKLPYKERNEKYHSIGTAFFVNEHELVTAAHVLNLHYFSLLTDFHIRDADGQVYKIGRIKKYSALRDLAVFELENYPKEILPLRILEKSEIGDTVFSVGNAQGEGISFRAGQIASYTVEPIFGKWRDIRFTSPASPGNSGGPLLNTNGEVIGIIVKKNSSENYNVALPVEELRNLSEKAEFYIKSAAVYAFHEQNSVSADWSASVDLPETIENVSLKAQTSLNAFYSDLAAQVDKKFQDSNLPKGPRFRSYLREQVYTHYFGALKTDPNFRTWNLDAFGLRKIPVDEKQNIYAGKSRAATFHVVVEKPRDMTLSAFLSSPKVIMDNLLKALPITRDVAGEKIRLTSWGEPEKTEVWSDKLGRKWTSSLWHYPPSNFVASHCLPYPSGAICNVDIKGTYVLRAGYEDTVRSTANEIVIGYDGTIKDWQAYFALGKKHLPEIFEKTKLSLKNGVFKLAANDFSVAFEDKDINESSIVHFHLGYSNQHEMKEDLLLFELFPEDGVKNHYRVQKYFTPSEFSSEKYKSFWKDIKAKSGDFSGKVYVIDNMQNFRKVQADALVTFKAFDGESVEQAYVVGCSLKVSEEDAEKKCDDFEKGVSFK